VINDAGLMWAMVAVTFAAMMAGRFIVRRFRTHWRPIPAYQTLPTLAADAVESAKRVHFSLGSSAVGGTSTLAALVSAEVVYRLAERLAISRQLPLVTLSHPVTLPLAQDTLRRAYLYRRTLDYYRSTAAAWYPPGTAFAVGAASLSADIDADSNVLLGRFGPELAFLGESALRHNQALIAHSDVLEGQAIAFAQAGEVLLGEELYAGPAYLGGTALERGSVLAQDVLRWLVILGIVLAALQTI
jgi:hypothetical protein